MKTAFAVCRRGFLLPIVSITSYGSTMQVVTWYIEYRICGTLTAKGQLVRKRCEGLNKYYTLASRRKRAKIKLAEIRELIASGFTAGIAPAASVPLDMRKATLIKAIEYVVSQKILRRGTEEYNRLLLRLREFPALGGMPARLVTPVCVGSFMSFITNCPKRAGSKVSNKSYNRYRNTLSTSFNFLVKREMLPRNPSRKARRCPRLEPRRLVEGLRVLFCCLLSSCPGTARAL